MSGAKISQDIVARAEAILARMSLEHKVGQMIQTERMVVTPDQVREHHLGSVLSGGGSTPGDNRPADWIAMNDAYWAASMAEEPDRVPVPILYGVDAIHGHANVKGATVFPHNIGLGAANDPELMERIAQVTAREILATGVEWTFAPTLAVTRNERWGRTYESYSEDPAIVTAYAGRFVRGLQAGLGQDGVIACAKHWVGDGGTTGGVDQGNTEVSEADLERLHIAPYYPALAEGVLTVMASFNGWNGAKCHGHRYLLTEVLKGRMGFAGFIISDWDGTDYLSDDYEEAVALGANAGIDMFMVSVEWRRCLAALRTHVASGRVPMDRIDDAVRRILTVKLQYGLFERPRPAERYWSRREAIGVPEHRDVAREAVRKSLVLLKNDGGVLPLDRTARILVTGKNADNRGHQCGGFTLEWQGTSGNEKVIGGTSVWEGIRAAAPNAELCPDGATAQAGVHRAAVVVIGERPYAEGMGDIRLAERVEPGSGPKTAKLAPYGATLELAELHPEDLATIRAVRATGVPVVVVLISGRPLVITQELEAAQGFVAAWLPGSEGQGIADVLFGDHDFRGRLACSWPKAPGDRPNLGEEPYAPLFPFGFGLSYGKPAKAPPPA